MYLMYVILQTVAITTTTTKVTKKTFQHMKKNINKQKSQHNTKQQRTQKAHLTNKNKNIFTM